LFGVVAAAIVAIATEASLTVVIIAVVLLVTGAALVASAASAVGRSARVLAGAADEIAEGHMATRIEVPNDDLGVAAGAFNRLADRIEARIAGASQERNRLMAAINSSVDAVIAVDAENNVTFANAATEVMLEKKPDEIVGQPFVWVVPTAEVIQALRDSRESGVQSSLVIERPVRRYLRAIVTPIRGGGEWASLVVFHDLTDVKRVEDVRRDFAANVSHELRTPLAAIKSVIETLQGGAMEDTAVAKDFLERADSEVDRLVQMVEELLELSRIESGELEVRKEAVDIGETATAAVDRLRPHADRAGVTLKADVAPSVPAVLGDRVTLERAVMNLVHNAIKFTEEGGSIDVGVRAVEGGIELAVQDTGVGIEAQDLPRVFERFYKTDRARRAGGTGLGLAVVKHTVEAHGGRVWAESTLGSGSTFRMWLPAAPNESPAVQRTAE
jgi:two-component system phosphate regulon sensor histidine kinase PhoR